MKQSTFLRKALHALINDGWKLIDIEGVPCGSVAAVVEEFKQLDHANVTVERNGSTSFLFLVWQGPDATYAEGEEVIADYGMTLDPILHPLYQ